MVRACSILHNLCLDAKDSAGSERRLQAVIQRNQTLVVKEEKKLQRAIKAGLIHPPALSDSLADGHRRRVQLGKDLGVKADGGVLNF